MRDFQRRKYLVQNTPAVMAALNPRTYMVPGSPDGGVLGAVAGCAGSSLVDRPSELGVLHGGQ
ncbi:hypothetical protein M407DRAFT_244646 [Tulasnella calospora MUT 4182]|uniref:Uncharacterized protein n=1 Tax=Tulasnella calospora MUT 4182 TaxID=1051891 RepID=A0A0C3LR83_9AGAM|nr:hypothetical protein M407DRAFT_244646 [Tulasnella calospora MUT 4182]